MSNVVDLEAFKAQLAEKSGQRAKESTQEALEAVLQECSPHLAKAILMLMQLTERNALIDAIALCQAKMGEVGSVAGEELSFVEIARRSAIHSTAYEICMQIFDLIEQKKVVSD